MIPPKEKAFTLIELLVVIAIIGLLAGIVLVGLTGAKEQSRDGRRKAETREIKRALEICASSQDNEYPDTRDPTEEDYTRGSLKCLGFGTGETCFAGRHSGLDSLRDCLPALPVDPSRTNAIFDSYLYSSHCHTSHHAGGGSCIYWQPEGTISNESCAPGLMGNSGSDVCGYACDFCTLKIGD